MPYMADPQVTSEGHRRTGTEPEERREARKPSGRNAGAARRPGALGPWRRMQGSEASPPPPVESALLGADLPPPHAGGFSSEVSPASPSGEIPPGIKPDAESRRKFMLGLKRVRK